MHTPRSVCKTHLHTLGAGKRARCCNAVDAHGHLNPLKKFIHVDNLPYKVCGLQNMSVNKYKKVSET